jgi:hypothetical protein
VNTEVISKSLLEADKARFLFKKALEKSLNALVFFDSSDSRYFHTKPSDSPYRGYYRTTDIG